MTRVEILYIEQSKVIQEGHAEASDDSEEEKAIVTYYNTTN